MIYKSIHTTFLVFLFSMTLQGQNTATLRPDMPIEGNIYQLHVSIVKNNQLFRFSDTDIICSPGASGQILGLAFEIKGGGRLPARLPFYISSSGEIDERFGNSNGEWPEGLNKVTRNFQVQDISNSSNSYIQFTLKNVDNSLIQHFRINVSQSATSQPDCNVINNKQEKLNCLSQLTSRTLTQNNEWQRLRSEKNEAQRVINNFRASSSEANVYHISCTVCNSNDFSIDYSRRGVASRSNHWLTKPITEPIVATISHKVWNIKKTISLNFIETETTGTEEVSDEEAKAENEEPNQTIEDGDSSITQIDSGYVDSLATPFQKITQDTFWQDSIAPLLNISNVFYKDQELFRRLAIYQASPTSSTTKKALAAALPHALPISIGLFVLLLLALIRRRKKSKNTPGTVAEILVESKPKSKPEKTKEASPLPTKNEEPISKATIDTPEEISEKEDEISFDEVSIDNSVATPPLEVVKSHPDFLPIDLLPCWRDTNVEQLFIHKACIRDLGLRLEQENATYEASKDVEELSEIGGFLLGYVYPQDDRYDLAVSTFVPITPESNDRYAVKFGDQAWTQLDDAYHLYPGQRLIGWFHTHPGHGLFLSKADIDLHKSAFQKPYQFAMEIDPMTAPCDIAFFTRQPNGALNNMKDRRIAHWWSFKELEKKAKIL